MSKVFVFLREADTRQIGAENKREAWMPRSGHGYFDKSARQFFHTRQQKRAWLARHGMREAGELYNPEKALGGNEGNMRKR